MGSVTAKVVACDSTCVRGNAVTSPVLMCCARTCRLRQLVMGDQGYDRDKIREMLAQQGITPCIPPRRYCKKPAYRSKRLHRKGHKIENLFPD